MDKYLVIIRATIIIMTYDNLLLMFKDINKNYKNNSEKR